MEQDTFKDENLVKKIGGRLERDYYSLKRDINYINDYFFGLFQILGLTDDIDLIIDTLNDNFRNLRSVFIAKTLRDMEAGKIPHNRGKAWEDETMKKLYKRYKEIYEQYLKDNGLHYLESNHSRISLELCRKTLFVAPSRIEIDGEKFIEVYSSFMEADESETKKLHEQAAAAINRFFNGSVVITQEELSKYFVLKSGIVKPNPKSINKMDYARLGARTVRIHRS